MTIIKGAKPFAQKALSYALQLIKKRNSAKTVINSPIINKQLFDLKQAEEKMRLKRLSDDRLQELKDNPLLGPQLDEGGDILRMGGQTSAIRTDWKKNK